MADQKRSPQAKGPLGWLMRHVPTHEQLEGNRWLRPFAHVILRPELWRFTRRSVPRGVALGLFVGVMIPLAHFLVATIVAVFVRANIPSALAATFIGFPAIYIPLAALGYKIGETLLHADAMTHIAPVATTMHQTQADRLLEMLSGAGKDTALGLFILATIIASIGYVVTAWLWRWWIGRKLRLRREYRDAHGEAG